MDGSSVVLSPVEKSSCLARVVWKPKAGQRLIREVKIHQNPQETWGTEYIPSYIPAFACTWTLEIQKGI